MSEQNVKIVREVYEAFGARDIPAIIAALAPGAEWWDADNFIYALNSYIGPDVVLDGGLKRIAQTWEAFTISPENILDAGDVVISYGHYSGTHKENSVPMRSQFAHFFTFENGQIAKFQQYIDTGQLTEVIEHKAKSTTVN